MARLGRARIPKDAIATLNRAMAGRPKDHETQARLAGLGVDITPEGFAASIRSEISK